MLMLLDAVGARYGKWPSEVLDLSVEDLSLCVAAWQAGADMAASRAQRTAGGVMPVWVVNGR